MKLLPILLICPILSYADVLICKVVAITDGDTIICLEDKVQHKIRLYHIDAPESKQDFAIASRKALSDLIFNKTVRIHTYGKDRYRRTLGTVYIQEKMLFDINLEMINKGMAWYRPFGKKNEQYLEAEEIAKANKVGLWSQQVTAVTEFKRKLKYLFYSLK
ncbi:thermonuclease family protein [Entomomonas asaccharolytica]|uniref:Thermonuclease family protein n=1 Tax=Entomomonas asaccharolytica TaxID=2785331 RepID=A0A974RY16_9GAMM|nr:thermonuclease family protein [Entomomonas asaccharolytica]QQP86795.1 thermonuclease family protein [Entomomonas asaccharolytica]